MTTGRINQVIAIQLSWLKPHNNMTHVGVSCLASMCKVWMLFKHECCQSKNAHISLNQTYNVGTMCLNIQQNTDSMRSYKVYLYSRKPMLPMHRRFSLFAKIENATEVQPTVNYAQLLAHVAMLLIFKSKINRYNRALSKGRPPMRIFEILKNC